MGETCRPYLLALLEERPIYDLFELVLATSFVGILKESSIVERVLRGLTTTTLFFEYLDERTEATEGTPISAYRASLANTQASHEGQ